MSADFITMEPMIQAARKALNQGLWDYVVGGTESETTLRQNRAGFDRLAFRPRILVDVTNVDPSTTFLGHQLRIPVLTAPIGGLERLTPEGGAGAAAGAAEYGTVSVHSSVTGPTLEEIAAAADGPKMFQLYVRGDTDWARDILGRMRASGFTALVLTVDTAVGSRRERPMISIGAPTPSARDHGAPPRSFQAELTWDSMERIREIGGLPFMLKGIQTAEDAALAVDHGVDVIWVSNHGGRQLDHARGSMQALPEIVEAVAGRAKIVLDGGIHRGSDVIKAIALGADAVAIGRLQAWGLAAAGKDGLVRVLEILEAEMRAAMALLGVTSIDQLGPQYVCPTEPVTPAHEMSSWVNIPGGRIQ